MASFIATYKNKKDSNLLESFLVLPWAHMDLNHGPPDYESGQLTFVSINFQDMYDY